MAQFNVTELDFDRIKENLIDYYKKYEGGDKYKDYDFDGSGLNILMDILAYNTHYNAIQAHTAINESFLDSAQLRSNVVSRAKLLAYVPGSITAATCALDIEFDGSANDFEEIYTLPRGAEVTTVVDGIKYPFTTLADNTVQLKNGKYEFSEEDTIRFHQGKLKRKRFTVRDTGDQNQKFFVDDITADISTLKVKVYDNAAANGFTVFEQFKTFSRLEDNEAVYFLTENYQGSYEVTFGNGIYGLKPQKQNIVELEYLSTDGEGANGATQFIWASENPLPTSIKVSSKAAGGSPKENTESIRFHAPLTFATQERAVTADDYVALIKRDFPSAQVVSVWGGQDNDPPAYGKVFVSIKPSGGFENLTYEQKESLRGILESKNVASTDPVIIDPDYTYLYFDILFKYNSSQTDLSRTTLESKVRDTIIDYNNNNLLSFNTAFRYSNFLCNIDNSDNSIINTVGRVYAYKKLTLVECDTTPKTLKFDFEVAGDVHDSESLLTSDTFTYQGLTVFFNDEPLNNDQRKVTLCTVDSSGNKTKVENDIGVFNVKTGTLELSPIPIDEVENTIKLYCTPASNDVVAKRNNLLQIDSLKTIIVGTVDSIAVGGSSGALNYQTFNRER